jgi:PhnB protein
MTSEAVKTSSIACSCAPMLSVRNGARALEFYKSAFGATEAFKIESPDGAVVARLSVDGAEFWVADESPEHQNFSPESLGGVRCEWSDSADPMRCSRRQSPPGRVKSCR